MFDRWFACGECIPPSPEKVCKVFERRTLGLDLQAVGERNAFSAAFDPAFLRVRFCQVRRIDFSLTECSMND
jgi:hypothetical protein